MSDPVVVGAGAPVASTTAAATAAVQTPKNRRDVYFIGPIADVLVTGGGLSFVAFLIFWAAHYSARTDIVASLGYWFSFVVNWPHFAATSFRLYQSSDRMMQFPKTSFVVPVLVFAGTVFSLQSPEAFAPWFVKLYLTWSGYHYSGQTKGIALLYARRLGVNVDPWTRRLIVISAYSSWLYAVVDLERGSGSPFYAIHVPVLWSGLGAIWPSLGTQMPYEWDGPVHAIANGILAVGIAALVMLILKSWLLDRAIFPIAALAPMAAQILWFGPARIMSQLAFSEFIPLFHSLQYLVIAWLFQLKEQSADPSFVPGGRSVLWETAKWGAGVFFVGMLWFAIIPWALQMLGYRRDIAEPAFISAVNVHHFFVDGVIWKIRDPRTRAMLAGNIWDLAGYPRVV
jgi:hypothetical protein